MTLLLGLQDEYAPLPSGAPPDYLQMAILRQ
jgi:hypothetical protein